MPTELLLKNALIVTMDDRRRQFNHGALLIRDGRIHRIDRDDALEPSPDADQKVIDLSGRIVMPGLINTHVHTSQQLGRGLADDVDLLTWLRARVWPYESNLSQEDSYVSTLLCGIEQIRSGVTCIAEAGGQHVDGMGRAISELGLRAVLSRSTMDTGEGLPAAWRQDTDAALATQVELITRWRGQSAGRIRVWFGLRTIFNTSDDLIVRTKSLADHYGVGIHMHVAEVREEVEYARAMRGATTVTHLDRLGALDRNLLAVHTVWLTEEEIRLFAERDVKVSHNPAAAMRVLGFAKIPEMLAAGICVALGTDGAPCNNRMTLIDDMWLASLIHKGRLLDPTAMPAQTVLEMATRNGARAVLWDDEIGSLAPGKSADLIVIDPRSATMLPMHDPIANLVSSLRSDNVESVMVGGQWLMWQRRILTVNESEVLAEAESHAANIASRAGLVLPQRFHVVD